MRRYLREKDENVKTRSVIVVGAPTFNSIIILCVRIIFKADFNKL